MEEEAGEDEGEGVEGASGEGLREARGACDVWRAYAMDTAAGVVIAEEEAGVLMGLGLETLGRRALTAEMPVIFMMSAMVC